MKTEWQYFFEAKDLFFKKEYKYICTINGDKHPSDAFSGEFEFEIKITPDEKQKDPAHQTGEVRITLPLSYDKAEPIVHELLYHFAQKVSFDSGGHFYINTGMMMGTYIPETPEEEEEIGENKHFAALHLIEAVSPTQFDSKSLEETSKKPLDMALVSQHNVAKASNNSVERFLGFFKIIESQFHKEKSLRECLESNKDLLAIFKNTFEFETEEKASNAYIDFIKRIVHARHRCAHLKLSKNFGYAPIDHKIKEEVEPYLEALEILTSEIIKQGGVHSK